MNQDDPMDSQNQGQQPMGGDAPAQSAGEPTQPAGQEPGGSPVGEPVAPAPGAPAQSPAEPVSEEPQAEEGEAGGQAGDGGAPPMPGQ